MWSTLGVLALFAQLASQPAVDNWALRHRAGVRAIQTHDYAGAERELLAALAIAEAGGPADPRFATTLNSLGLAYAMEGKYADADRAYRRAVALYENAGPQAEVFLAGALHNLAVNSGHLGRYADAHTALARALQIEERLAGPNNLRVALTLHQMGELYLAEHKYKEADPPLSRALLLRDSGLGDHIETIRTIHALALAKRGEGQLESAEALWVRGLQMQQVVHTAPDAQTAEMMEDYADLLARRGATANADALRARARSIRAGLAATAARK